MSIEGENDISDIESVAKTKRTHELGGNSRNRNITDSFRLNRRHLQNTTSYNSCLSNLRNRWNHNYTTRKYIRLQPRQLIDFVKSSSIL